MRVTGWQTGEPSNVGLGSLLGPLEQRVMLAVWDLGEATVEDVLDQAKTGHSYTTVKTVMERLVKKGLLHRQKDGRAYVYRAAIDREGLEAQASRRVIESLMAGFGSTALSQFAEVVRQDPAHLAELRRLLQDVAEEES